MYPFIDRVQGQRNASACRQWTNRRPVFPYLLCATIFAKRSVRPWKPSNRGRGLYGISISSIQGLGKAAAYTKLLARRMLLSRAALGSWQAFNIRRILLLDRGILEGTEAAGNAGWRVR